MQPMTLIDAYLGGPALLRQAVAGMTQEQLVARPVPRKWSTLEVICHLADFEIIGADRIKRVIAENEPALFGGDEKLFAARLAYHQRSAEEELLLIALLHQQVARILRTLMPEDFQRSWRSFRGRASDVGELRGANDTPFSAPPSIHQGKAEVVKLIFRVESGGDGGR